MRTLVEGASSEGLTVHRALTRAATALTTAFGIGLVSVGTGVTLPTAHAAGTSYSVVRAIDPYTGLSKVMRWSPCTRTSSGTRTHYITYRVNPAGVGSRVTLVKQAIAKLSAASGLQFRYVGTTSYVPHNDVIHYATGARTVFDASEERARTHAELVVAWASGRATNMLTPVEAGVGTASWSGSRTSQLRIVQAAVVIRRGLNLLSGFASGSSAGALLLHELGHAVGLEHVTSTSQIMYPVIGSWSRASYHSGDRSGLRLVGAAAGCFATPAAAPANPVAMARLAGVSVTR
jgi:hypothetical protein